MRKNLFGQSKSGAVCESKDNVFATFLLTKGLYDSIEISKDNIADLISLLDGCVRMSTFCKECGAERVFSMQPYLYHINDEGRFVSQKLADTIYGLQGVFYSRIPFPDEVISEEDSKWMWRNWLIEEETRLLVFKYMCAMDNSHHLDFVVLTDNDRFTKIGQYPSVADLSFPELDEYKKVLSAEDRKSMRRAIGLFASGIGVGSYVYLRRVLERLLMKAKEDAGDVIDEQKFREARIKEKISLLKDYLPPMLTGNPAIYGILSKGIHELTEEECLTYFPVVKDCIYMIIDEWEDMRKRREKELSIKAAISQIASKSQ